MPTVVKKDFNACEDFIDTVVSGHVLAAAMSTFGMMYTGDTPVDGIVPEDLWMETDEVRKEWLYRLCKQVYDRFIAISLDTSVGFVHTNDDSVSSYAIQLLRIGIIYLEFADAIREGDGQRVLRCWRYFLPIFRASNSTNYSCEALHFLYQHKYILSPRLSNQLMHGRFINVHGLVGRNIPLDLHMEHLNRFAKDSMRNLSSNKTQAATVARVGKSLGTLTTLVENFDAENSVHLSTSRKKKPSAASDIKIITDELVTSGAFSVIRGRKMKHFKKKQRSVWRQERRINYMDDRAFTQIVNIV